MEKTELLNKLDELLKDIHPSNQLVKNLAKRTIEIICDPEKRNNEYKIEMTEEETNFFINWEAMDVMSTFTTIFCNIGIKLDGSVSEGVESGKGEYIKFKVAA